MDYTKLLLKILVPNKRGIDRKAFDKITKDKYPNIYNYIMSIYPDSFSVWETIKRLILHIDIKPTCPTCGGPVLFVGKASKMFTKYCSNSCRAKNPEHIKRWVEGQREYNLKHFGVEHNFQREDCKAKREQSLIEHYGTTALPSVPELKQKMIKTSIEHFGVPWSSQSELVKEKRKNTCYELYGVSNPLQNKDIRNKLNVTMKKNGTFNKSKDEDKCYQCLCLIYPDVIRQYKSDVYPYNCDFYIPSIDTYIEYNGSWTHGKKPYEGTEEDKILLETWEQKNTKFYNNAIRTWSIRDVEKRKIAKENNLNYIEIWNLKEIYNKVLYIKENANVLNKEYNFYNKSKGKLKGISIHNNIVKFFQQDTFFKVEKKLFENDNIKNKIIENRKKYLNKELLTADDILTGFKRSGIYYGYSHFNPLWFKWFIEQYNCKKCYDPCGGWGHRLLGANELELYIYNDLSTTTYNNVNRIIEYFNISNTITYNNDANYFIPKEDFDSMFTCPPYFNLEHYECKEFKALEQYNEFIDNLFNIFYNSKAKIFGLVIREDLLPENHNNYNDSFIIHIHKAVHLHKNSDRINNEYLYIYIKE